MNLLRADLMERDQKRRKNIYGLISLMLPLPMKMCPDFLRPLIWDYIWKLKR